MKTRLFAIVFCIGLAVVVAFHTSSNANAGAPTYDPYSSTFVVPAARLSWTSGNYTTTLTRFDYEDGLDYVTFTAAQSDGIADWNGVFDLEVVANVTPTPEPASMMLVSAGLLIFGGVAGRRQK